MKIYQFLLLTISMIVFNSCTKGGGDIVKSKPETKIPEQQILSPKAEDAYTTFTKWKNTFVTSEGCPVGKRVLFDDGIHTVSEGIGYGMLGAAFLNDKELLDDLFLYYNHFKDARGLMHWRIDEKGKVFHANAATDADEDVAMALIIAGKKWGNTGKIAYLDTATKIINLMKRWCVEANTYVLKPGDVWGGSSITNPSYFEPAYYKVYFELTKDSTWLHVSDKCYEILQLSMHPNTGLVPDWCRATGETPGAGRTDGRNYSYDACRTPWRIANDALWYQDSRAISYCNLITEFVKSQSPEKLGDGYQLDGKVISGNFSNAFIGPFGCAAIISANNSELSNKLYTYNVNTEGGYYNQSIKMLTLIFQTGLWQKP